MTCAELLEVIYSFYPRGMFVGGLGYEQTVERQRQRDAARRGVAAFPTWKAMIRRLGERYRLMDHSLSLLAGGLDPAYSADIDIPEGGTLYFHVSLLGPYYGIHRTGAPGEEPVVRDIAREIEATYPGYQPIPPELGDEVVPDVCVDGALLVVASIARCEGAPRSPSRQSCTARDLDRVAARVPRAPRFGRASPPSRGRPLRSGAPRTTSSAHDSKRGRHPWRAAVACSPASSRPRNREATSAGPGAAPRRRRPASRASSTVKQPPRQTLPPSASSVPSSRIELSSSRIVKEVVRMLFHALSPDHQRVIDAVVFRDLSQENAGRELGLAQKTVGDRVTAALAKLRELAPELLSPSQRALR
jgi:hypothetical protein